STKPHENLSRRRTRRRTAALLRRRQWHARVGCGCGGVRERRGSVAGASSPKGLRYERRCATNDAALRTSRTPAESVFSGLRVMISDAWIPPWTDKHRPALPG